MLYPSFYSFNYFKGNDSFLVGDSLAFDEVDFDEPMELGAVEQEEVEVKVKAEPEAVPVVKAEPKAEPQDEVLKWVCLYIITFGCSSYATNLAAMLLFLWFVGGPNWHY